MCALKCLGEIWENLAAIQDGSQNTGSTTNFAGFIDIHVVPKTIHGFLTM